jgi:hypothetical protein
MVRLICDYLDLKLTFAAYNTFVSMQTGKI